ncbi:hypothetical protein GWK74_02850 [Candidatus Saccharibacteria bacterium oral taxon 488]|nr:hypothetical protein GWK74_02850 [Candidatus Saccharibacteria bacterium oral taxon 488]
MNGNASYRQYLQYHANNHPSAAKRAEAQALLNVVGDDQRINGNFLTGERHGLFGMQTREQRSNGYSASSVNRSVNPWWQNSYNSWRQARRGGGSDPGGNQNLNLGYYGGGGGGGYYGGGNRASAAQLAEYDQGIGQLEHGLGRIDSQLGVRLGNISGQYNTKKNELRSSWNRAEGQFNDQTRQNQQQRRTNINNINDRSAVGLRGLLRSLGSMGAVGSDMQLAGRAVQNQANQQRSGAGQTYAQNQRQIDTTWGQFKNDYADEDKKLNDWKANEDSAARQASQTTRQNLLTQLAQLRSQKAAAQGANGANAARADLARANALSGEIDSLGRQQNTYTGNKVQYNAKDLDSYKVTGDTSVGVSNPAAPGSDPTLNIYNTRLNQEEERKRQNQYL